MFLVLGAFSLTCFAFSVRALPLSRPYDFVLTIAMLGISLDMLRFHHRRMTRLLEPSWAIVRLSGLVTAHIAYIRRRIHLAARLHVWAHSPRDNDVALGDIEAQYYSYMPNHRAAMVSWAGELAETAIRALGRSDASAAKLAIGALVKQSGDYLSARRDNLCLRMDALMVFSADVHEVLSPIYDRLKEIHSHAVRLRSEPISIEVIRALGATTRHTTNLRARAFRENTAPISWLPLGYLDTCASSSVAAGFDDAALEAARILMAVAVNTPPNLYITDVHTPTNR